MLHLKSISLEEKNQEDKRNDRTSANDIQDQPDKVQKAAKLKDLTKNKKKSTRALFKADTFEVDIDPRKFKKILKVNSKDQIEDTIVLNTPGAHFRSAV